MERTKRFYVGDKGKPWNHIVDYNGVDFQESFRRDKAKVEFWMAKKIGEDLVRQYPKRQWNVDVDTRNEMVIISAPYLSKREGYHINIGRDSLAQLLPRCRKAAGEILERFGITRGHAFNADHIDSFPRDLRDDAVVPDRFSNQTMKFDER